MVAITRYHRVLNNRHLSCHNFGGQKSEIKVSAGHVPAEGARNDLSQASLPDSGGFLAIFGVS